ncbi:hypothetical protein MRX96_053485 [Rhipicephalus microplus]
MSLRNFRWLSVSSSSCTATRPRFQMSTQWLFEATQKKSVYCLQEVLSPPPFVVRLPLKVQLQLIVICQFLIDPTYLTEQRCGVPRMSRTLARQLCGNRDKCAQASHT